MNSHILLSLLTISACLHWIWFESLPTDHWSVLLTYVLACIWSGLALGTLVTLILAWVLN